MCYSSRNENAAVEEMSLTSVLGLCDCICTNNTQKINLILKTSNWATNESTYLNCLLKPSPPFTVANCYKFHKLVKEQDTGFRHNDQRETFQKQNFWKASWRLWDSKRGSRSPCTSGLQNKKKRTAELRRLQKNKWRKRWKEQWKGQNGASFSTRTCFIYSGKWQESQVFPQVRTERHQ